MREYRKDKIRKHRLTLSDKPLGKDYLFESIYSFVDDTLDIVRDTKSTAGLQGRVVESRLLYIDLDSLDEDKVRLVDTALSGLKYTKYFSGNKGYHWHVPHQLIKSTDLVYSHKSFITALGLTDIVDTSIYREAGIIRRAGTIHEVTGKRKEVLKYQPGKMLELPIVRAPAPPAIHPEDFDEIQSLKYKQNLLRDVPEGGRHTHFYILYRNGLASGRSHNEVVEDIVWYNNEVLSNPKPHDQLMKEIRGFKL